MTEDMYIMQEKSIGARIQQEIEDASAGVIALDDNEVRRDLGCCPSVRLHLIRFSAIIFTLWNVYIVLLVT